jgi:uncharacterized OB-fold protein
MTAELPRPFPIPDRDTKPFWDAQNKHELRFQKCSSCGQVRYPVGPLCPQCRSFDFDWITSSGRGAIYSYTIVRHQTHPAFAVPYTMLLVEMEEGPRVIAQLRGDPQGAPDSAPFAIGDRVRIEWEDLPEQTLPVFVLDA